MMQNSEIAKIFWEIAELLELKGENPFKVRAYQKAARNLESLSDSLEELYQKGGLLSLENIPGVGKSIAEHIEELIRKGKIQKYESLLKEFPKGFIEIMNTPGMGPKTAMLLLKKLKIDSLEKLEKTAKAGKLRILPGMGAKKEENILRGIDLKKKSYGRFLLDEASSYAELIVEELQKLKEIKTILPCGSLRRGKETIGDIDILVTSSKPAPIMEYFVKLPFVKNILAKGETKASVVLSNGMQADLRVVEAKSFGAAAHYFTGSKEHNIHIRQLAQKKGWKVSEYGIFSAKGASASGGKGKKQIGGEKEEDMFSMFGFQFIPPELRENRGEFEAAAKGEVPQLIELKDIKGDLHMHTKASDGSNSIEEMAEAAKTLGYEYILITDHSGSTRVAGGLTEKEMEKHIGKIRAAQETIKGITVLAGAEVDILPDGRLDYPDALLKQFDIVIGAIHSNFKMAKEKMTDRILKAFQNKYLKIFVHPTGRLLKERNPYEVDLEKVLEAAKKNNIVMELNSHPKRLDLTDIYCRRAKELGVKIAVSTDAHATDQLKLMKYGIITARRGWLEKKDVINTLSLPKFKKFFHLK